MEVKPPHTDDRLADYLPPFAFILLFFFPISNVSLLFPLVFGFFREPSRTGFLQPHTSLITPLCRLKAVKFTNTAAFQSRTKRMLFQRALQLRRLQSFQLNK